MGRAAATGPSHSAARDEESFPAADVGPSASLGELLPGVKRCRPARLGVALFVPVTLDRVS